MISELCDILQPFGEIMDRIRGEAVVTSSLVVTCVRGLRHTLCSLHDTYNCKLVSALQTSVETRLMKYKHMKNFKLVAVLKPCFKLDWCTEEEVPAITAMLTSTASSRQEPQPSARSAEDPPPTKRSKLFTLMADHSHHKETPESRLPVVKEITNYLNEHCLDESGVWPDLCAGTPTCCVKSYILSTSHILIVSASISISM